MTDGRVRARKCGSRGGPHGAAVVQGASGGAAGVSVGDSDTRKPNMGPGGLSTQGDPHSVASVLRQTRWTCPVDTPKCIPLGESLLLPPLPPVCASPHLVRSRVEVCHDMNSYHDSADCLLAPTTCTRVRSHYGLYGRTDSWVLSRLAIGLEMLRLLRKNRGLCIQQKRAHPITPIWPTNFTRIRQIPPWHPPPG
jgi:hypothetical protein